MELGMEKVTADAALTESDREAVNRLKSGFHANYSELYGLGGFTRVADADLDSFAGFIQQDREQASGIYISGGVLLLIIILLLIFH